MSALVEILDRAAATWWTCMLHATWQSSLVAVAFLAIAWLGRRWPAQLRYALLLIALVKFATPPMLPTPVGLFSHLGPAVAVDGEAGVPAAVAAGGASVAAAEDGWALAGMRWQAWAMLAHAVGTLAVTAGLLAQWLRIGRIARRCELVEAGPLHEEVHRLRQMVGLRRSVRILVAREAVPPMAFGLWRPAVLVPRYLLDDAPLRQLRTVLAHELAHHRRGDMWINWLQGLLAAAWWFNPVFRLLNRTVRRTREDCCDDMLLASQLTTDETYCEALLRVASRLGRNMLLATASAFARQVHPLADRITRIMDRRLRRARRLSLATAAAMLLLAVVVLPGLRTDTSPVGAIGPMLASSETGGSAASLASGRAPVPADRKIDDGTGGSSPAARDSADAALAAYLSLAAARRGAALDDGTHPLDMADPSGAPRIDSPQTTGRAPSPSGAAVAAASADRSRATGRADGRLLDVRLNLTSAGVDALGPAAFIDNAFTRSRPEEEIDFRRYIESLPVFQPLTPAESDTGANVQLVDRSAPRKGAFQPSQPPEQQFNVKLYANLSGYNDSALDVIDVPFDLIFDTRLTASGSREDVLIDGLGLELIDGQFGLIEVTCHDPQALLAYLNGVEPWADGTGGGSAVLPEPAVTLPLCLGGLLLLRRRRQRLSKQA
jgi:beta-lactamase regulating signal transducer with metallopeptidase domain